MHTTHLLGAGALIAALGWLVSLTGTTTTGNDANTPTPSPQEPPIAAGHLVLVVEGDRNQLAISHANAKADPWAGVAKGADSAWTLLISDASGKTLAAVPLDVVHFDTNPDRVGGPIKVDGCIVRDPRIAMLVSVPNFAAAASYTFTRREADATVPLGTVTAARVQQLVGGGR